MDERERYAEYLFSKVNVGRSINREDLLEHLFLQAGLLDVYGEVLPFTEGRGKKLLSAFEALGATKAEPLALSGKWFRAHRYALSGPWVEAAARRVITYDLKEALPEIIPALLELAPDPERTKPRKSPPPRREGKRYVVRMVNPFPLPDMSPGTREGVLEFFNRFGPLGIYFRDIYAFSTVIHYTASGPVTDAEVVCGPPGGRVGPPSLPVVKFFGNHLRDPEAIWKEKTLKGSLIPFPFKGRELNHSALHREYRETTLEVYAEAWDFKLAHLALKGKIEAPFVKGDFERVLSRCHVSLEDWGPAFRPRSLIDACYVFLLEAGRRWCPECGRPFQPRRSDQKYCSERCRYRRGQRAFRKKAKAEPPALPEGAQGKRRRANK